MLSETKSRFAGKTFLQILLFFLLITQICFAQWYQQTSGTTRNLNDLSFYDLNNGIVVGDSGIILGTTNGGTNWIVIPPSGNNTNLHAVSYKSGIWVAVGSEGTILHNGNLQTSGTTNDLFGVSFTDANTGTAVGDSGTILRTTNGGTTWNSQTSGTTGSLSSVSFTDVNTGTAVGSGGTILKTTDGGTTWNLQLSGTYFDLAGVSFIDTNYGFVVGYYSEVPHYYSGEILSTSNGGNDWSILVLLSSYFVLNNVFYTESSNGTVVGKDLSQEHGLILRTTDAGENWITQVSGTQNALNGVYFTDNLIGWIVGDYGTILHTTNGGVSFVEEEVIDEIPTEFLLSQNYPNPFNPSTKIKYSIPPVGTQRAVSVQVKVYDILGNEIEILVNEEKSSGTYEITWDAEQLPSGVYFYQLRAGDYINTKKMVLLK